MMCSQGAIQWGSQAYTPAHLILTRKKASVILITLSLMASLKMAASAGMGLNWAKVDSTIDGEKERSQRQLMS